MESFWDRVMILMRAATVVELASLLEVKRSTLSSWIHTDRRPPLHVAMKIIEQTGTTLEWLEHGSNWESSNREEAAENITKYKKLIMSQIEELDPPQLELIQSLLHYFKSNDAKTRTRKEE